MKSVLIQKLAGWAGKWSEEEKMGEEEAEDRN
jgi:hypothetical protein